MKKKLAIIILLAVGIAPMSAQYYSVNIDYKTAAAMQQKPTIASKSRTF